MNHIENIVNCEQATSLGAVVVLGNISKAHWFFEQNKYADACVLLNETISDVNGLIDLCTVMMYACTDVPMLCHTAERRMTLIKVRECIEKDLSFAWSHLD